jgi:threonine-phosphate decarboxylase
MNWPDHGGQPNTIKQLFNLSNETELIDFSANLNPLGPPRWLGERLADLLQSTAKYPDPNYGEAHRAIAFHERLNERQVLITNGGAEAIYLVAKHVEGKRALIVQPTFSEYERACRHYHIETEDIFLDEDNNFSFPLEQILNQLNNVHALFLCRPNNPTGTAVQEDSLRVVLDVALRTETIVVVDEAFADFAADPETPLTGWIARYPNLILLRSLTKMYTIPGVRIGYIIAGETVISSLRTYQIPWSVNALAASLAPLLLNDVAFAARTRAWLKDELLSMGHELQKLGFYQSATHVNFYVLKDRLKTGSTDMLYKFLLNEGILARHTHTFKGLDGRYLRLAVRSSAENRRLIDGLYKWRQQ